MRILSIFGLILSLMIISGCSTNENDPVGPDNGGATLKVTVNAAETYFVNLASGEEVMVADYLIEDNWDLRINNLTNITVNGGASAPGEAYVMLIENSDYAAMKTAPNGIYETDTQHGGVIGENWYWYDPSTHTVNPVEQFYVIKTGSGNYYKFQISESVFTSRTDGELSFKFEKISSPSAPEMQDVSGRVRMAVVELSTTQKSYFQLKKGQMVTVSDVANSTEWDFQTDYVTLNMNGGTSGSGVAGAIVNTVSPFDSIDTAPMDGYVVDDTTNGLSAIGDDWYDYDFVNHTLTAKSYTWLLKTATGKFAKMEFVKVAFSGQSGGVAVIRFEYLEDGNQF